MSTKGNEMGRCAALAVGRYFDELYLVGSSPPPWSGFWRFVYPPVGQRDVGVLLDADEGDVRAVQGGPVEAEGVGVGVDVGVRRGGDCRLLQVPKRASAAAMAQRSAAQ